MRRVGILMAVVVLGTVVTAEANAQILGPTIIGPSFGGPGYGRGTAGLHDSFARREFQRQMLHAAAHRQGLTPLEHARLHRMLNRDRALDAQFQDDFFGSSLPPTVFLPPASRATMEPFAGSPKGGNYYYWLSREYAQGRVSKSEYNRQVYGIGRK